MLHLLSSEGTLCYCAKLESMTDKSKLRSLLLDAAERGAAYRESLGDRPVAPSPDAVDAVTGFVEPLPSEGAADEAVLAMLDDLGTPATISMAGPRFFGFVIGGSLPVTVATNWLTTAWDQNVGMHEQAIASFRKALERNPTVEIASQIYAELI